MITCVKPCGSVIKQAVRLMQAERDNWKPNDPRQELLIDPLATEELLTQLAENGQCVVLGGTYLTAWVIYPQWFNPDEAIVQELLVIRIAEFSSITLDAVIDYYRQVSEQFNAPVLMGDLLSSRQATYGRALRQVGATPIVTSYLV